MIILFGAPGAGKSVQGQILAIRYGWRWLSTGQLFRESGDERIIEQMKAGGLVDDASTRRVFSKAIRETKDFEHVVLDGFPRALTQAKWLVENQPHAGRSISLVIVLEVPGSELKRRLTLRGRQDDSVNTALERIDVYHENIRPVIDYLIKQKMPVVHMDGTGTVGTIHDRIVSELEAWRLI